MLNDLFLKVTKTLPPRQFVDLLKIKWKDRRLSCSPRALMASIPNLSFSAMTQEQSYGQSMGYGGGLMFRSSNNTELPIIFDTGASMSVTPLRSDFEGELETPSISSLRGLKDEVKVIGIGKVSWNVYDLHGVVRTIKTKAYLVPEGNIRLLSPQTYFQENGTVSGRITAQGIELETSDGTIMHFPYECNSNLPLMLTRRQSTVVGLTYYDGEFLSSQHQVRACLSVADEANHQNITAAQKELLLWHQRLAHANFQWVQWLASTPRDQTDNRSERILETKHAKVSSCDLPLTTLYCMPGGEASTKGS